MHDPIPATSTSAISRGSAIHAGHPATSAAPFGRKEAPTGHHGMMSGQYGQNIVRYDNAGYWLQICYFTGMSNMILQGGFKAAGTLEATINGDLAFLGNAILYAIFAFGCLLMPPLLRWTELRSQIKFIAFLGGFGYTFYLYVNTTTPSENPGAASWVIYLIGSTMVGLGAPLVWIPTLEMVSRSAYFHVRDLSRPTSPTAAAAAAGGGGGGMALFNRAEDGDDDEGQLQEEADAGQQSTGRQNEILPLGGRRVERDSILSTAGRDSPNTTFYTRLDRNLSRFNGIFYGIFQLHGLVLYPLGAIVANTDDTTDWRQPLFWTVAMLPLAASFVFLMIPPIPKSDLIPGTPPPDVRVWKSIKFIVAEKLFRRLAPSIIVNGMVFCLPYIGC
ncbi:hypothetical protein FOZ62_010908 [Perkinsus olseni]|uniref:Uncharacterized protein n=1 Tax=Perkinsus olseni TaxID=32597 RepID=A0A7J6SE78_PEROL|nr:hypothetical protein FOZ62_010908 [Perkinsus olseni]